MPAKSTADAKSGYCSMYQVESATYFLSRLLLRIHIKKTLFAALKYTRIKAENPASYNAKSTTCTAVNRPRYEATT